MMLVIGLGWRQGHSGRTVRWVLHMLIRDLDNGTASNPAHCYGENQWVELHDCQSGKSSGRKEGCGWLY